MEGAVRPDEPVTTERQMMAEQQQEAYLKLQVRNICLFAGKGADVISVGSWALHHGGFECVLICLMLSVIEPKAQVKPYVLTDVGAVQW